MTRSEAIKLALSVLEPFAENSAYEDYRDEDGWTDEQYGQMLDELKRAGPYKILYAAHGPASYPAAYASDPFDTRELAMAWAREQNGAEFDVNDQNIYLLHPDLRLEPLGIDDLVR